MIASWSVLFPRITFSSVLEIAILAYIVYEFLLWIKNTRAWLLLRGLVFIFVFTLLAYILQFDTILWLLGRIATIAVTAIVIIFQPELRKALEQLGSRNFFMDVLGRDQETGLDRDRIGEITKAVRELSGTKTGALIVVQRGESLADIEKTGIMLDASLTSQLLINIFEHNTPLHDGAVVIRDGRVAAATCYLPLSHNSFISKDLGTRHRAAVGISEVSDSMTIVVSEETGRVSLAVEGRLLKIQDTEELGRLLQEGMPGEGKKAEKAGFVFWRGKKRNESNPEK